MSKKKPAHAVDERPLSAPKRHGAVHEKAVAEKCVNRNRFLAVAQAVERDTKWLLEQAASNDEVAAVLLVEIATMTATFVQHLVDSRPDLAIKIAENRSDWSIVISRNPTHPVDPDELRKSLRLETKSSLPFRTDSIRKKKPWPPQLRLVYSALFVLEKLRQLFELMNVPVKEAGEIRSSADSRPQKPYLHRADQRKVEVAWGLATQPIIRAVAEMAQILGVTSSTTGLDKAALLQMAAGLQAPSNSNKSSWFKAVCQLILSIAGGKHSDSPALSALGSSGKSKFKGKLRKLRTREEIEVIIKSGRMKKSQDHDVWEIARTKFKTAFDKIWRPAEISPRAWKNSPKSER